MPPEGRACGVGGTPRKRSLATRISLLVLAVTTVFSVMAGWNVLALRAATQQAELMRSGYLPLALALRDSVLAQDTWSSQLTDVTTVTNPIAKKVWFDAMLSVGRPRSFDALRQALHRALGGQSDTGAELADRLSREASDVEEFMSGDRERIGRLFVALQSRDTQSAQSLRDALVRRSLEGRQRLAALEQEVSNRVQGLVEEARSRETLAVRLLVLSAVFTLIIGLGVAWRARRLLAPLVAVTQRAKVVAEGDLTPRDVTPSPDELGELAVTFEGMVSAIARANAELLSSERLAAIGKMAAQVTHEVRNPLSSLALNLELLEEELGGGQGEVAALLSAVQLEVDRLTQLTEKYLSLARRSRPRLEEESLVDLVGEALDSVKLELERARVKIDLKAPDEIASVWVDESQVRQVLLNLFRNAREAMPEGGTLSVALTQPQRELVVVAIRDTGQGMDSATRSQIFEPFFTTKGHGTGLGLAITREIVEAHGGKILCEANKPQGTGFNIELPVARPEQKATGG